MIITKTPFRMSFFGGGTDMESFFRENGGAVLSTTFDKYCYVNVRHLPRFFDYSTELSYSKTERVTNIDDIQHPAIRNAMKMLNMHEIRLTYEADLPARSGLGTSSSFAVGMLNAFYALKGKYADKKKLADEAIYLERNLCQEAGGWQDQIAASFGGFNRINFNADGYEVLPVIISPERKRRLNHNLMMFFTGFTRFSSDVQKANAAGKQDKIVQLKEMLLTHAVDYLDQHSDVGIVTGKIMYEENRNHFWFAGGKLNYLRGRAYHYGSNEEDLGQYDQTQQISFCTGCLMVIPVEALKIVGPMREDYFLYYEDTEYSARFTENKYKMVYLPSVKIYHKVSASTGGGSVLYHYYNWRNRLYFIEEHVHGWKKFPAYLFYMYEGVKRIALGDISPCVYLRAVRDYLYRVKGKVIL